MSQVILADGTDGGEVQFPFKVSPIEYWLFSSIKFGTPSGASAQW